MSKMSNAVKKNRKDQSKNEVINFMGGVNYELSPMETLRMVSASSIFGEPQYYRDGEFDKKTATRDLTYSVKDIMMEYSILSLDKYNGMKSSTLMEKIIDEALSSDFMGTLEWAKTLRTEFLMRLNPQIIMVRAAIHKDRIKFTNDNPGVFAEMNKQVMTRADDVISQITYYLYIHGDKKNVPGILKKSWAKKISSLRKYEVAKYKNAGIGMIDAVRISHASSSIINELLTTGTIEVDDKTTTWERLRSSGMSWFDVMVTLKEATGKPMNHMALLRNLRGILTEITDIEVMEDILKELKAGVQNGKQLPYRYLSAYRAMKGSKNVNKDVLEKAKDALEDCMNISCKENMPKLGKSIFLVDNSGSAWGAFVSRGGEVSNVNGMTMAEIMNTMGVVGSINCENGMVVCFGDEYKEHIIKKDAKVLETSERISKDSRNHIGGATEGALVLWLNDRLYSTEGHKTRGCVQEKVNNSWFDDVENVFILSDMQAGYGELYGDYSVEKMLRQNGWATKHQSHMNIPKILEDIRKDHPKINYYLVSFGGYNNTLAVPAYRLSVLSGFNGKEVVYADAMNKFWDEFDKTHGLNK